MTDCASGIHVKNIKILEERNLMNRVVIGHLAGEMACRILVIASLLALASGFAHAATLSGTVIDTEGQPLDGICVDASDWGTGHWASVQTDASGEFSLILPGGEYHLGTRSECAEPLPPYENRYWSGAETVYDLWQSQPIVLEDNAIRGGLDFVLALGRQVRGRVTGPGGAALSNVAVNVFGGSCWGGKLGGVHTDQEGNYVANARSGEVFLEISPECPSCEDQPSPEQFPLQTEWWSAGGHQMSCHLGEPVPEDPSQVTSNIDFELAYATRLCGRVLGEDGAVPEGAIVQAFGGPAWQWFLQDRAIDAATGQYALCLGGSSAYVRVFFGNELNQPQAPDPNVPSPTRYAGEWWNDALSLDEQDPYPLNPSTTQTLDFTLAKTGCVTGVVRDLDTGNPVGGIGVGAWASRCLGIQNEGDTPSWIADALTDSEGRYYLWLAGPAYLVTCDDCIDAGTPFDGVYTHRWWDGNEGRTACSAASLAVPSVSTTGCSVANFAIRQKSNVHAAESLCSLDVDGNGERDALTDGILSLRYLAGSSGTTLTDGAVDEDGCTRCTAVEITAHLASPACQALFDADGNGERNAPTDGILVLRYLFGFSRTTLTDGAIDPVGCTRCTAAAIVEHLTSVGFVVHINAGDPQFLEALTGNGEFVEYFGTRDNNGMPAHLSEILVTNAEGSSTAVKMDANGKPRLIIDEDRTSFELQWLSDTEALLIGTASDGSAQVYTVIDISEVIESESTFAPKVEQLASNQSTRREIEAQVNICGLPAENADVRLNVNDIETGKRLQELPMLHDKSGRYIAEIAISGVDLAPARDVCNTIDTLVGESCNVAVPLATSMVELGGCAYTGPLASGCVTAFSTVLVSCALHNPSPVPGGDSILKRFCEADVQTISNIFLGDDLSLTAGANFPGTGIRPAFSGLPVPWDPFNERQPPLVIDAVSEPKIKAFFTGPMVPSAGQSYTATAQVACAADSVLTISVGGSDGYTDSETCNLGANEQCSLVVPGAEGAVKDTITLKLSGSVARTINLSFHGSVREPVFVKLSPNVQIATIDLADYGVKAIDTTQLTIVGDFVAGLGSPYNQDIWRYHTIEYGGQTFDADNGIDLQLTSGTVIEIWNHDVPLEDNSDPDGDLGLLISGGSTRR